MWMQFLG